MKVDFNNVRRQAVTAYSQLVETLKERTNERGEIDVGRWAIEDALDDLRSALATIALTYEDGNPDFQDVLGDGVLPWLSDEQDDE